jgi:hypothetical protein
LASIEKGLLEAFTSTSSSGWEGDCAKHNETARKRAADTAPAVA